jgi:hypothetical protein
MQRSCAGHRNTCPTPSVSFQILHGNRNGLLAEIKSRLNSGNAYYHSVHNILSSCLLSINIKIAVYRTIILLVVLYGHESLSLTLRQRHWLRVLLK